MKKAGDTIFKTYRLSCRYTFATEKFCFIRTNRIISIEA